ncbi:MAG TPA: bifunctional UDP-N-acetylglucosamine diphosphorylase/glucosamine-1-phosphate N-acetyltransferase GlmU [Thermoanaerobaculia bacterium]|nr:bifunctional UDP-N-acetylglucosamine diphosphorylase/glucosamine-1-phosphate N-acetyltransferase GlmU [Thermoanaerobaculia bacterium]
MTEPQAPERVAVVLAAGEGKRMRSARPKVLHTVAGRPMLAWVLDAARRAGCRRLVVVVGRDAEAVRERFAAPDVELVEQSERLGTGHAVAQAERVLGDAPRVALVLSGDAPLVRPATLERLLETAERGWGAVAVAEVEYPGSLGRVVRRADGLERIVEAADADAEELEIRTVNSGHYALRLPELFEHLRAVSSRNAQGEIYLTDAVVAAAVAGRSVACVDLHDPVEAWGINDRADLARAERALLAREVERLLAAGVTVRDPARVVVEAGVEVAADSELHPDVTLLGACRLGAGVVLHQGAWVRDSELAEGVVILPYSVLDGARVGPGCTVGPFARLRPGSVLGRGVRIGNFVEVKKSVLGDGTKANHLAYLGDATVGAGANIGAGVVTCNYDGTSKHRTEIGEGAFVGSDTMLVAPVRVGDRSVTGAGSVITDDVPDDSLGLARARQRNLVGWTARRGRSGE